MLYGVGFPPGFQLQGDGPLLLAAVMLPIPWPVDPNPCRHIYFAFQAESRRPNVLFYIHQLGDGEQSRSILALARSSAVVRAEESDVTQLHSFWGFFFAHLAEKQKWAARTLVSVGRTYMLRRTALGEEGLRYSLAQCSSEGM